MAAPSFVIIQVMLLALVIGCCRAKCPSPPSPSPSPSPYPSPAPSYPPTMAPANVPMVHLPVCSPRVHTPSNPLSHSAHPPAHAPSPTKTTPSPKAAAPSHVVHSPPAQSPLSISSQPSVAPAPAENAAVFNRFPTVVSVVVSFLVAVSIL